MNLEVGKTMKLKDPYCGMNKSTMFILPLLAEGNPVKNDGLKKTHKDFMFKSNLFNTYIRGFKYDDKAQRPFYMHYHWTDDEFKDLEEYLQLDLNGNKYLGTIEIDNHSIVIAYDICNFTPYPENSVSEKEKSWVSDYDAILSGKYSVGTPDGMSSRHAVKILDFFYGNSYSYDNFLRLLFRRDALLWHSRKKELGCKFGKDCTCSIDTKLVTEDNVNNYIPLKKQNYRKCQNFEDWQMPENVELESKLDLEKETWEYKRVTEQC